MKFDDYKAARETVISAIHSSLRHRPEGFNGVLSDLKVAEGFMAEPVPSGCNAADWRLGVQSVVQDCNTAIRTY